YSQQQQQTKSNAEKTVNISFQSSVASPSATVQIPAGSTFNLDVYVDPGTNSVSLVKLDMKYDPTRFQLAGGFIPNSAVFPQVVEGPIGASGSITTTLSIGSNLSAAIKTRTKVGTLELKAIETAPAGASIISFGSDSQALSVSANSSYEENVIASTTPVTIQINKPSASCGTSPGDTMLVMDTSGSMNDKNGTSGTKLSNAITSATNFVNIVSAEANNRIGLVNFSNAATLDSSLTSTFASVSAKVNALKANGETCIQCGIDKASQEIGANKRAGIKNAIIILTDGLANYVEGSSKQVSTATAEQAALTAATNDSKANGTVIYAIGLGQNVDSAFLTKLATSTGGQYYFSPTTDQLNDIYSQISQIISGGSISGTVFSDLSGNGVFDPGDPGVPGVVINLIPSGSSTPSQSISSSSDGTYSMQNVCNGAYTLTQTLPTNWIQTLPVGGSGYSISMTNGVAIIDKNFGEKENLPTATPTQAPTAMIDPTPTPTSGNTGLALNVLLDGIGNAGDNANPAASTLSNKSPGHPTRDVLAQVFDTNNNLVATASGDINYSSASGSFVGTVYTSTALADGNYTLKVRSGFHLTRRVPGVSHLIPNQVNQIPTVELVAGDANNDNRLDILDYNLMIGCYSDLSPAVSCDVATKPTTDFNDDGAVNQFDYNLFLRELSTQPGD
ncbi:MAG TPA: VWA domain-containing protein, partial [Candidatus Saccharimonadales bacterium]|nr:VWA domain-containing protein [Candidatus Saccharimonadales bacterium]